MTTGEILRAETTDRLVATLAAARAAQAADPNPDRAVVVTAIANELTQRGIMRP